MKFKVDKKKIAGVLAGAADISASRAQSPYLKSIWLEARGDSVAISATDSTLEFTGNASYVEVEEEGLVGILGSGVGALMSRLPNGEITFSTDENNNLVLAQTRRHYRLPVTDAKFRVELAPLPDNSNILINSDVLSDCITQVSFCLSTDNMREVLANIHIAPNGDDVVFCALDGHQYAQKTIKNTAFAAALPKNGILISGKGAAYLQKWLKNHGSVEIGFTQKRFFMHGMEKDETISCPLTDLEYPDVSLFLNKLDVPNLTKVEFDKNEAIEAFGRIALFAEGAQNGVIINLDPQEMHLFSQARDANGPLASESLECEVNGNLSQVAFPVINLIEILKRIKSGRATLELTEVEGPARLTDGDSDYFVVIMPLRTSSVEYVED